MSVIRAAHCQREGGRFSNTQPMRRYWLLERKRLERRILNPPQFTSYLTLAPPQHTTAERRQLSRAKFLESDIQLKGSRTV